MPSQSNEDEIIAKIFEVIGEGDRTFVEFGCAHGEVNNTVELLLRGWSGHWYDIRKKCVAHAKRTWDGYPLTVTWRKITPPKVNLVVKDPLDFLSIDVDGEDYMLWAYSSARPRVVCIESVTKHPFDRLAENKGYRFVSKSASGVNTFYVRGDQFVHGSYLF
jgi:hypothetical protein